MALSFAKLDVVLHRARTHGTRAAAQLTRDLAMEWIGGQLFRLQYPTVDWGENVRINGKLTLRGTGRVVVGDGCWFDSADGRANAISVLSPDAVVILGPDTYLNGASIVASERIEIGAGCVLGQCTILDSDFHPLDAATRGAGQPGKVKPVIVGRRVWLGTQVLVMKGVTIGDEAVVGGGTVVRRSVRPRTVVIGNPQEEAAEISATTSL